MKYRIEYTVEEMNILGVALADEMYKLTGEIRKSQEAGNDASLIESRLAIVQNILTKSNNAKAAK